MDINKAASYLGSICYGFETYRSYRNSRPIYVGWKEQTEYCAFSNIMLISSLVLSSSENLKALCGENFTNRVSSGSYFVYVVIPGLYLFVNRGEKSRKNEEYFLNLEKEFPQKNNDNTLGARIEQSPNADTIRTTFKNKYPMLWNDSISLKENIDAAYAQSKRSGLEKIFFNTVNFTFIHIADAALIITAIQSIAATYFCFKRTENLIRLLFCTWAIAEQGLFWMNPRENSGPLCTVKDGALFRAYRPAIVKLSNTLGVGIDLFYKGLPSKIITIFSLLASYPPFQNYLKQTIKKFQYTNQMFAPTPQAIEDKKVIGSYHLIPTEKHFEVFEVKDCFPEKSLDELENEVLNKLQSDTKLPEDSYTALTEILGEKKIENGKTVMTKGFFQSHILSSEKSELERDKQIVRLKNIYGALLQEWDQVKQHLLTYYGTLNCHTTIEKAIIDLSFEVYPLLKKELNDLNQKSPEEINKIKIEQKILLILQHSRDIQFQRFLQTLPPPGCQIANHHLINTLTFFYGMGLGISSYEEAKEDVLGRSLHKYIGELLAELPGYSEQRQKFKGRYKRDWYEELRGAILDKADTRLDYSEIGEYLMLRAKKLGIENELVEDGENMSQEGFLGKYLSQVLFDIGLLVETSR